MSLDFQLAQRNHAEMLQHLWEQSHALHYGPDYLQELKTYNAKFVKKHRLQFDSFFDGKMEDGQIYIAYQNKNPVGYVWLTECQEDPETACLTEIFSVEKGIGTPAIKKAEEIAKSKGKKFMTLEAYQEQTGFYEKHGYAEYDGEAQRDGLIPYAKTL